MEPRIQYAKTSDGVSIAYAVLGEGTPLLLTNAPPGRLHVYGLGLSRLVHRFVEAGFKTPIYDGRGMGSSDRRRTDFSIEAHIRDLEAVIGAVGLERFIIGFARTGGHAAAAYAVRQPERVSHLVAVNPSTAVRDVWRTWPVIRAMGAMEDIAEEDWENISLMITNSVNEFTDPTAARKMAEAYRSGVKASTMIAYWKESIERDPAEMFASIGVPALVVFDRSTGLPRSKETAQRLAQSIPGAQFVETDDAARAIAEFVGIVVTEKRSNRPSGTAEALTGETSAYPDHLTQREVDVLRLIAAGRTNAEISRDLVLSPRTVARHITNIYGKIGARGKADATAYAIHHQLTED